MKRILSEITDVIHLLEGSNGDIKKGDYVSGSAQALLYDVRLYGYAFGNCKNGGACYIAVPPENLDVNKKRWKAIKVTNAKKERGGNPKRKRDALKFIKKRKKRGEDQLRRSRERDDLIRRKVEEIDWEGLKGKVIELSTLLKSVKNDVSVSFFNKTRKKLINAWDELDKKNNPLFDWDGFIGSVENDIKRRAK